MPLDRQTRLSWTHSYNRVLRAQATQISSPTSREAGAPHEGARPCLRPLRKQRVPGGSSSLPYPSNQAGCHGSTPPAPHTRATLRQGPSSPKGKVEGALGRGDPYPPVTPGNFDIPRRHFTQATALALLVPMCICSRDLPLESDTWGSRLVLQQFLTPVGAARTPLHRQHPGLRPLLSDKHKAQRAGLGWPKKGSLVSVGSSVAASGTNRSSKWGTRGGNGR